MLIKYVSLFIPYIYAVNKVDHLIIGEVFKKKRYDIIAPNKPKTIIGYYPFLRYFNQNISNLNKQEIVFGYAGVITYERGINELLDSVRTVAQKYPEKKFRLIFFGRFTYSDEEKDFKEKAASKSNLIIEFIDWTDYYKMSAVIEKMDICFDLRKRNFIYSNSLPIKLFEYMACGKPIIYSDIEPIRVELDVENHGLLVNPESKSQIVNAIEKYIKHPELAITHSRNSRKYIESGKNWESESIKLLDLVESLLR